MTKEIVFLINKEVIKVKSYVEKAAKKAQGVFIRAEVIEERANNSHIDYSLNGNRIMFRIKVSRCMKFFLGIIELNMSLIPKSHRRVPSSISKIGG